LRQTRYLDNLAATVNATYDFPRDIALVSRECGTSNARYIPDATHPQIELCYEWIEQIQNQFARLRLTQESSVQAFNGALAFTLMHEIGHALVHEMNLPITGREEDVADQFATVVLSERQPAYAVWAARFFQQMSRGEGWQLFVNDEAATADEHGLDRQRFYNIVCWTYGASPGNRSVLLQILPQERAQRCPGEAQQIQHAWSFLLNGRLRRGVASAAPPPPQPNSADIAGSWAWDESIADTRVGWTCSDSGTLTFVWGGQDTFQQQGRCIIAGQVVNNPGSGILTKAMFDGASVSFMMGDCTYRGALQSNAQAISGTVTCATQTLGQAQGRMQGTWRAWRR
jgi:hypothetical protein